MSKFSQLLLPTILLLGGCSHNAHITKPGTQGDIADVHAKMITREKTAESEYKKSCGKMNEARQKLSDLAKKINSAMDEELESQRINPDNRKLFDSVKPLSDDVSSLEKDCRAAESRYITILEYNHEYFKNYKPAEVSIEPLRLPPPIQCYSTKIGNSVSTTCY